MSTDIQRRPSPLAPVLSWFSGWATHGWRENVQFLVVCVFVLLLHLIAAPVLKRAAADPEPGGAGAPAVRSSGAAPSTAVGSGVATSGKAEGQAGKKSSDSLIFTDSKAKPAAPAAQKVPPPVIPSTPAAQTGAKASPGSDNAVPLKDDLKPAPSRPDPARPAGPQLSDLIGGGTAAPAPASGARSENGKAVGDGPPAVKVFRSISPKP